MDELKIVPNIEIRGHYKTRYGLEAIIYYIDKNNENYPYVGVIYGFKEKFFWNKDGKASCWSASPRNGFDIVDIWKDNDSNYTPRVGQIYKDYRGLILVITSIQDKKGEPDYNILFNNGQTGSFNINDIHCYCTLVKECDTWQEAILDDAFKENNCNLISDF